MTIADEAMQSDAGDMIARWGGPGYLLNDNNEARPITVAILDYNPRARGLALEGAERAIISAVGLDEPPDYEHDKLWHGGKLYQIPTPVKGPRPGGIVMYHDADIVYESVFDITPYLPS